MLSSSTLPLLWALAGDTATTDTNKDLVASTRHMALPANPTLKAQRAAERFCKALDVLDSPTDATAVDARGLLIQRAAAEKPLDPPPPGIDVAALEATFALIPPSSTAAWTPSDAPLLDAHLAYCRGLTAIGSQSTLYKALEAAPEADRKARALEQIRVLRTRFSADGAANKFAGAGLIAGGWQSSLVQGLASFVASRAEAEVSLWLVQSFGERMCPAPAPGLKARLLKVKRLEGDLWRIAWFPETCALIGPAAKSGVLPGGAMIAALREDVEQLPGVVIGVLLTSLGYDPSEQTAIVDAVRAVGGALRLIRGGTAPLVAIGRWGDANALRKQCPATTAAASIPCWMAVVGTIAQWTGEFCTEDDDKCELTLEGALTAAELVALLDELDPEVLQKYPDVVRITLDLWSWFALNPKPEYDEKRTEFGRRVAARVLESVGEVLALRTWDDPKQQRAAELAGLAIEATHHMMAEEYADGSRALIKLVDPLIDAWMEKRAVAQPCEDADEPAGACEPGGLCGRRRAEFFKELRRYVLILVDLTAAKDSESVQAALQSAAAPVGGWRMKREKFGASLTALVGFAGSLEFTTREDKPGVAISPLAALGLDLSGPVGRRGWTLGGFLSVIDLGQLVSARLTGRQADPTKEGASTASEVQFLSVVSPGAYFKVGIGRSPFAMGLGVAYAPQMRKYYYTPEGSSRLLGDPLSVLRVSVYVAVDATILPFRRGRRR